MSYRHPGHMARRRRVATRPVVTQRRTITAPTQSTPYSGADVTAGITTYMRPHCLPRLTKSLQRYLPECAVRIQDTGGNLSYGRNEILRHATTPYVLILEDDFELTSKTNIAAMRDVLETEPSLTAVGGRCCNPEGVDQTWSHDLVMHDGKYEIVRSTDFDISNKGYLYARCGMSMNFLLLRREQAMKLLWNEQLHVFEHVDFFKRGADNGHRFAVCWDSQILHHADKRDKNYRDQRNRTQFRDLSEQLMGAELNKPLGTWGAGHIKHPNVILMTIGHTGSSIIARMMHNLGWEKNDADEEFAEYVRMRQVNRRIREGYYRNTKEIYAAARIVVRQWKTPFCAKDPRLIHTLKYYIPHLPTSTILVHLTRNDDDTKQSYYRRNEIDELTWRKDAAQEQWDIWPWSKIEISYDQLRQVIPMFDVARGNHGIIHP